MVLAELRYTHNPEEFFKVGYCAIEFDGELELKVLLANLAHLITFDKYDKRNAVIACYKEQKEKNNKQLESLKKELKEMIYIPSVFAIWGKGKERIKQLKKELSRLVNANATINAKIQELENDLFYSVNEKKFIHKKLLNTLEFAISKVYEAPNGKFNIEVYESTISDKKLYRMVAEMFDDIKQKHEQELEEIKGAFKTAMGELSSKEIIKR